MSPEHNGERQSEGFGGRGVGCPLPFSNIFRVRDNCENYKQPRNVNKIWYLQIPDCPVKVGTDVTDLMDLYREHKWFGESVKKSSDMLGCQRFLKLISFGLVRFYAFLSFQPRGLRISGCFCQPGTHVVKRMHACDSEKVNI